MNSVATFDDKLQKQKQIAGCSNFFLTMFHQLVLP